MFAYYLQLALHSLRRHPALTVLMVLAVGFGVAASMITYSVFRAVSNNPIPQKSTRLYTPLIDNWGPTSRLKGEPPEALSYTDARALMRARQARQQTVLYMVGLSVLPTAGRGTAFNAPGYATSADFFDMFDVPFRYGSGWDASDDQRHSAVAVISEALNAKLFGGANSVGREIVLDTHSYRIVGVTAAWDPQPRYYDLFGSNGFGLPNQVYIPFNRAIDLRTETAGGNTCGGVADFDKGWDGWLSGECAWLTVWVELDGAAAARRYHDFLLAYAQEQRRAGRFHWAPNVRLYDVDGWLDFEQVVPPESRIALLLALGFLVICLVNTIGLLLAKFMRRAPEIGVRRALGATRRGIYGQYLVEAAAVGVLGGLFGLLLTMLGMAGIGLLFKPEIARLARLDPSLIGLTLLLAILATVLAAFYPAWRAAQVQPAWQLKSN